jgi:hypothetical protein
LLGGNGTRTALFAVAAPVSATDKAITTATFLHMVCQSQPLPRIVWANK